MRGVVACLLFFREFCAAVLGIPNYGSYLAHMLEAHPETEPLDYPTFFRQRQTARYRGRFGSRCC
jgi:uncharacterized short protein YbdD (DUF466 family)